MGCACAHMLRETLEGLAFVSFFLWLQLFQATTEQTAPAVQSHFTSFHSKHFNRLVIFLCFEQASKHHLHLVITQPARMKGPRVRRRQCASLLSLCDWVRSHWLSAASEV